MAPINELNLYSRYFRYDYFIITIIHHINMYEVWAGIDGYVVMRRLFGIEKKSVHDFNELLDMVRIFVDDGKYSITESIIGCE